MSIDSPARQNGKKSKDVVVVPAAVKLVKRQSRNGKINPEADVEMKDESIKKVVEDKEIEEEKTASVIVNRRKKAEKKPVEQLSKTTSPAQSMRQT